MKNTINPTIASLIVIAMISIATIGVAKLNETTPGNQASTAPPSSPASGPSNPSSTTRAFFKDGEYAADGTYSTPGGTESVGVTVTLKNDIVKEVKVIQHARGGDSAEYQSKFASGYEPLVAGKKIEDVKLDRVAGSSLTSDGFNRALEDIKRDAAI